MDERLTAAQAREVMEQRAAIYEFLSIAYGEEVPLAFLRSLREQGPALDGELGDFVASLAGADDAALEAVRTDLAAEYARVFLGMSRRPVAPYESVYTSERRLLMQEARAEVLATLRENELMRGSWNEAEDHIALELEFMQRMALRAAEALDDAAEDEAVAYLRTSYDFLENHLLNWVPMLVADMRMHARTLFYQGLAQLTLGSLQEDEAVLRELLDSVEA